MPGVNTKTSDSHRLFFCSLRDKMVCAHEPINLFITKGPRVGEKDEKRHSWLYTKDIRKKFITINVKSNFIMEF